WDFVEFIFARQARFASKSYPFRGPEAIAWHLAVEPLLQRRPDKEYVDDDGLIAAPPTWIWGEDPCPRMVTTTLRGLVENWQHSVHPYYQQGQAKVAQIEQDARELGRVLLDLRDLRLPLLVVGVHRVLPVLDEPAQRRGDHPRTRILPP